jgi:hypothetical protein
MKEARALEKELLGLERRFWQSMIDRDVDAALALTDEPCIVTGPQGVAKIDRKTFAQMMERGQWTLHDFDFSDIQMQRLSDNVAVLAYTVNEKLTVEGRKVRLEAADSSTWVRRDGEWRCAVHTEALFGDPFGRDRVKKTNGEAIAKKTAKPAKTAGAAKTAKPTKTAPKAAKTAKSAKKRTKSAQDGV